MAPKGDTKAKPAAKAKVAPVANKIKKVVPKPPTRMVKKTIGGENNGKTRTVRVNRMPRYIPTATKPKRIASRKLCFSQHVHKLRDSITPGTILIQLCGRHKGKRVIFLKQLKSGLLLVTGPYHLNGCPLRRINQIYVIATKTKVDVKDIKLPEHLDDEYFRRIKLNKPKYSDGEIFDNEKVEYTVSEKRREDQVTVDKQVLTAIKKHADKKYLSVYLQTMFKLDNHQYPHKMTF